MRKQLFAWFRSFSKNLLHLGQFPFFGKTFVLNSFKEILTAIIGLKKQLFSWLFKALPAILNFLGQNLHLGSRVLLPTKRIFFSWYVKSRSKKSSSSRLSFSSRLEE